MKASATILALLLVAGSAFGQESRRRSDARDYSRPTLLQLFTVDADDDDDTTAVNPNPGLVYRDGNTNYRLGYRAPLSGTGFGSTDVTQEWPDPFALTGTAVATSPGAWRTQRVHTAELRRIEAMERVGR